MAKKQNTQPVNVAYETGYKKPPKHTQFKKGVSGNPKGRKAKKLKMPDVQASLANALNEMVEANVNGKPRRISKLDLIMGQIVNKAASGQLGPLRMVLPVALKLAEAARADAEESGAGPTRADHQQELDELLSVLLPRQDGKTADASGS